jgi:ubiquinol-cytochrome c reductase cytochrome b subunit
MQFKPLMKISFWMFVANFLVLMRIGGLHPEEPYITLGLISTIFYFAWFLLIVPLVSLIEDSLMSSNDFKPHRGISGTKVSFSS